MTGKIGRHLHALAFGWRMGAELRDKLTLMWLLSRHIPANRGWIHYTSDVVPVRIRFGESTSTVHLRQNATDRIIFADIFDTQCYALELDQHPKAIIDAGANIGLASLYFSMKYPSAQVASFEPVEHATCKRNANQVFEMALGKENGSISILLDPVNSGGHRLELYDSDPNLQRLQVPLSRLDTLIAEGRVSPPDFLKIDAEGAECDILEGLGSHWSSLRTLLAETQSKANHQWIVARLTAQGFTRITEQVLHADAALPHESYSIVLAQR